MEPDVITRLWDAIWIPTHKVRGRLGGSRGGNPPDRHSVGRDLGRDDEDIQGLGSHRCTGAFGVVSTDLYLVSNAFVPRQFVRWSNLRWSGHAV